MTTFETVSVNSVVLGDNGYNVAADDTDVTIDAGILVASDKKGFETNYASTALHNHGNVLGMEVGSQGWGVFFSAVAPSGTLINEVDGRITGYQTGIVSFAASLSVTNNGQITGLTGNGYYNTGALNQLVNTGTIFGYQNGVVQESSGNDGGSVENSGRIEGRQVGINLNISTGFETIITNHSGGAIAGESASIRTENTSRLTLTNELGGVVSGDILCTASGRKDTITNPGKIVGDVYLGSGNDIFEGAGGTSGTIFGEAGHDILSGGKGRTVLSGGGDDDTFDFNVVREIGKGAKRDVIQDFLRSDGDQIDLHTLDANTGKNGNQNFKFIGADGFGKHAGELRFADHVLAGDVNGDGKADFEITLTGVNSLQVGVANPDLLL